MAGPRMSRRREQAIAALLTRPTVAEAAQAAGVAERTLRRWFRDPAFAAEYRAAQRQSLEAAIGSLQGAAMEAVAALRRNLLPPAPAAVQTRAAVAVLEQLARWRELDELAARVAALEAGSAMRQTE